MARAKVSDVKSYTTRAFASMTTYITDHKPEDIDEDNYFHTLSGRYLYVGDVIEAFSILDGTAEKPKSWAEAKYKVVGMDKFNTSVQVMTPWMTFEAGITNKPADEPKPEEKPAAKKQTAKKAA